MAEPLRWQIGDVAVTRIVESCAAYPSSVVMPPATPEILARHLDWLQPHFVDDKGDLIVSVHGLVVESKGKRILVDTCMGPHAPGAPERSSSRAFLDNLAAAGFAPEDIDVVLCTHMHFDHVGWNTVRQGDAWVPTFPNARYLFSQAEWDHWHHAKELGYAMTLAECVTPIIDAGLADLVAMDHALTDEVRLIPTPGHTPGHVAVGIASGGEQAFITGDLIFHPVQWAEIEWASDADSDAAAALAMRKHVRETYGRDDWLIIGTHFAPPTAGHVVRDGESWRFRPQPQAQAQG